MAGVAVTYFLTAEIASNMIFMSADACNSLYLVYLLNRILFDYFEVQRSHSNKVSSVLFNSALEVKLEHHQLV